MVAPQNLAVTVAANSLLIVPQGFNAATGFKSLTNAGIVANAGATITIPVGKTITGAGSIDDLVSVAGALSASTGHNRITLNGGLSLATGGSVTLGNNGTLIVPDNNSSLVGGTLSVGNMYVAKSSNAALSQTSTSVTVNSNVYVANDPGTVGSYTVGGGSLSANNAYFGYHGNATFTQNGGTFTPWTVYLGYASDGAGAMTLAGGTLTPTSTLYVGYGGTGTLTQTGGQITGNSQIELGAQAGVSGSYSISAGSAACSTIYAGYLGAGQLSISGTGSVSTSGLFLGCNGASTGRLTMSGGSLTVSSSEYVGDSGQAGYATQTAGTHTVAGTLYVGYSSISATPSTYQFQGGSLSVGNLTISQGTLTQQGGTLAIGSGTLTMGQFSTYTSAYSLSAGAMTAGDMTLGYAPGTQPWTTNATLTQTGGGITANYLTLNPTAAYLFSGGTLTLAQGGLSRGTIDFGNGPATLNYTGLLDLSQSTLLHTGGAALTGAAGSILVLPPGTTAGAFASCTSPGLIHTAGTDLVIPTGSSYTLRGQFMDHLDISGNLANVSGKTLSILGGAMVHGATVTVTTCQINDTRSGIDSGSLAMGYGYVGYSANGAFTQSNGTVTASSLALAGQNAGVTGTYALQAGALSPGALSIGTAGNGSFQQSGGSNTPSSITIGTLGQYSWTGGTLSVTSGLTCRGTLDFGSAAHSFSAPGVVNFGQGLIANAGLTDVTVPANSLLILPAGFSTSASFHSFTAQGLVHYAGTTLNIPAGTTLSGGGTIDDFTTISGAVSGAVNFNGGFRVDSGGAVSGSQISINTTGSVLNGGTINSSSSVSISPGTTDVSFTHSAGALQFQNTFWLGQYGTSTHATNYHLTGGNVTFTGPAGNPAMMYVASGGTFVQDGGTVSIISPSGGFPIPGYPGLTLTGFNTPASYQLNSGTLTTDYLSGAAPWYPSGPNNTLVQTGGTLTVNHTMDLSGMIFTHAGGACTIDTLARQNPPTYLPGTLDFDLTVLPGAYPPIATRVATLNSWSIVIDGPDSIFAQLSPSDVYTLMTTSTRFTDSFWNLPSGSRVTTANGHWSFELDYGAGSPYNPTQMVITNIQAVPEPGSLALLAGAAVSLLLPRRRGRC
jgi:hypothetical protein